MNKKEKISVLISIVLISLLAIGAVSAADDVAVDDDLGISAADEIQAVDDTQINDEIIQEPDIVEETQATEGDSPTTGDDTLKDEPTKTFTQLKEDIGTEASEVTLTGTYKFDASVDTAYPIISRDLTINGPATIDGNGATRLLAVTNGATLTLKNLNLINGATNDVTLDTAGVFASGGNLDIQGCTFKNNVAYQHNGAIQVAGGSLIVKDSVFEGNIATKQAAAIWVRNTATAFEVINCTFTDNVARGATAIVDTSCANSKIIDSKFTGSSSANYGGALFLRGANSIVKNTIFDSNKAANGGAIFVYNNAPNCEIDNCTFTKNNASSGGSAIYVTDVDATISNCIFDSNYVPSGPQYGYAGTIYLNANVNPDDGTYINPDMNVAISKCIFVNNSAIRGSAIYSYGSNFVLENSIFLDNIATDEVFSTTVKATDIYLSASFSHHTFEPTNKTAIINNNWFGSTADNYTDGLQTLNETYGMWQGVCNVRLDNWYFLNITETAGSTYYDILVSLNNLYTNSTDEVTQVTDCALPDWNVSLSATKGTVTPTQVTLENGIGNVQYALTAEEGPGTITADALGPKVSKELEGIKYIVPGSYTELQSLIDAAEEGATIVLDHRIVYDANYDGADFLGGMSVSKSVTIIGAEGIEISGNHLARIFKVTNNAVLTLKDLTLCEGYVDSNLNDSGAIYTQGGNLDIQGCTFRHNTAYRYAGDIGSAGGYLKVKDSTFSSSRANSYAGSIFAQGTGLELTNCTFFDCNSNNAGVIYTVVPNAEISGCTFKNNRASASAAAIMAQGGPLKVKDTVFEANRAGAQSTLVATAAVGGFEVINCTFTDNIANGGVGTIDTQCPNTKIIDSKFTGSSCGAYGGAIRLRGANSVVRNTIFENNHAGYNGGAIYLNAAATNSRIENCTFKGNTAGQGGSAIYIVDADATVSNCIFDSNSVPSGSESGYQGTVYLTVSQYPGRTVAFSNCIFVNNSAFRGSAITSFYAGFTVENSIFLDNIATDQVNTLGAEARDIFLIPNPDSSNSPIVRNNWFGSTVDNYTDLITFNITTDSYQGVTNVNMSSWYFLDLAATAGESYYDLLISLNNLYTPDTEEVTQDANYNLPDLNVTVSATAGELTPTTAALENGIAHVQYALTAEQGPATVTADVSGIKVSKEIEGISDKVNREVSISTETITVAYPASGSITITASAPGTYVVHVGSNVYDAVIETAGGSATVTVPTLSVGSYDVSVTAPETDEYFALDTGKIATYTVTQGTVTVTSANVTVTYPDTGSVTITASLAGEYTVKVGDKTYTATITEDGGSANVPVELLDVGDYGISVSGSAGDNYYPIDTGIINYYHVLAGSITVTGQGTTVTYPDKGTIVITTDVAGAYTIKVGEKTYENVELIAGTNDFNVPDVFNANDYDVKVSANIANYNAITDQSIATYTVAKATPVVSLSADKEEITFGDSVALTGSVVPSDAGAVTYYLDGTAIEGNVLSGLDAGTYTVVAKVAGSANYNAAESAPLTITVNKAASSVTVDPFSFDYGASGSAVATLVGATGVTATIDGHDGAVSVDGATITVSGLPAGTYTMVVTTVPDENHNAVSINVAVTVNKVDSSVTVDPISFTYGGSASAVATLVGATGVTASIDGHDGAVSVDGATITVSGLPAGTYTMVVTTVPDENHNAVSANVAVTVAKADPNVVLIADKESIDFGDSVTLNYVLSPAGASGAVTYYLDGEPITGATLSDLAAGTYTVVAKYAGDDNFNAVDSNIVTITVNPVASTVAVDPISFDYGASGSATATLTGATGVTATIEGYDGAVAVEGNVITVSGLPAGTYIMVVTTIPDANHIATSIEVAVTVNKIASTIAIDPISFAYGGSGSATATLTGATGVTASIEGYDGAVAVEGNVITVSGLPSGSYTMVVTTVPDDNHYAVSINVPVGVGKDDATLSLTADNDVINFGDIITLTAVVSPADATGPITYYVDDTAVESNVLSGLAAGTYTVHAMYGGDDNYNAAVSNSISITVNKVASSVTVDPISFTYGESASATATLVGATGVNAVIDGHDGAVSVEGTTITVSGLPAGTYTMVVTTVPDANHTALSAEVTVTVNKAAATVSLSADKETIAFGESVALSSVVSPEGATGAVTYYLDGEPITGDVLSGLAVGPHTVVAKYAGNDNFNAAESAPLTITVNKADASVVLSADKESIAFGESVALSSVVSPDGATGAVTYYLDGEPITGATLSDLTVGTHTVVAKYAGDENYNAADSNAVTITVAPVDSSVTVDPISFTYGGSASAVATLVGAAGVTATIEGHDGAVSVEGTTITVSGLPAGTYTMVVTTIPDANHNAVSTEVTVTVNKADPVLTISANVTSIKYPESIKLSNTITPEDATGSVVYYLDGTAIDGDVLARLAPGVYTVTAKYGGNDNYNEVDSSNSLEITVAKGDVSIEVTAESYTIEYGKDLFISRSLVPADASVAVTYIVDGEEVDYQLISGLSVGTHTIAAKASESVYYNGAVSETKTVTVTKSTSATVTVAPTKEAYDYGEDVVLDVTVKDGETGLTGTVVVNVGGTDYAVEVTDGTGKAVVKGLADGNYDVTAKFLANDNYEEAVAAGAVNFVVNEPTKPVPTLSLTVDPVTIKETESATIKVSLVDGDSNIDGLVIVTIDGTSYAVNVAAGEGSVTVKNLAPDTYTIKGEFIGNDDYAAAFAEDQTLEVTKVAKVSMNVSSAGENLVIKLTDEDNNPVTGKVNVTIDGKTNEVTVNNGVATVPIGAGNHNVTVVYPGDDVHTGTQVVNNIVYVKKSADQKIKTKITVNKNQTITYNKALDNRTKYYVYATLTDINGKILVNKTVSFFAHKKLYVTKTNSKGQFRFCIAHVGAGECTHALTFIGDDDYEASFAVVCVTIKKQKVKLTSKARTFKATKKVKKLTATLKNSKGKAIAGKKITFVVNGKKYTAKTNKKGVATVKVKVTKRKTYKVKVQFAGDKTYAKKTISRKLKIT